MSNIGKQSRVRNSPVDEVQVRAQIVTLEVEKQTRKVLLKENLEGSKVFQHLRVHTKCFITQEYVNNYKVFFSFNIDVDILSSRSETKW